MEQTRFAIRVLYTYIYIYINIVNVFLFVEYIHIYTYIRVFLFGVGGDTCNTRRLANPVFSQVAIPCLVKALGSTHARAASPASSPAPVRKAAKAATAEKAPPTQAPPATAVKAPPTQKPSAPARNAVVESVDVALGRVQGAETNQL